MLVRAREKGLDGHGAARAAARSTTRRSWWPPACSSSSTSINLDHQGATDYADLIRRATIEAAAHRDELRAALPLRLRRRVPGHRPRPGRAAAGAGRRRPRPRRRRRPAPVDLRLPRRRGARHPRLPDRLPAHGRRARRRGRAAHHPPLRSPAAARLAAGRRAGCPARLASRRRPREAFLAPAAAGPARRGPGRGAHLRHRPRRGRAPRRPAPPRAPRGRRRLGRHGGAGALRAHLDPSAAPGARRRRRAGRGGHRRGAAGARPGRAAAARRPARRAQPRQRRPRRTSTTSTPSRAEALLLSPLGGLDAGDAAPPRAAAAHAREGRGPREERPPRPSRELLRRAVVDAGLPRRARGPRGRARPRAGRGCSPTPAPSSTAGATAEEVLWRCGRAPPGPSGCAARSSSAEARPAAPTATSTRSCALFEAAARAEEQRDHVGVRDFLATLVAQQIPADTLAERGVRGAAVRLLTAHRSKGLEWRLVVVAHVQQEGWPDLRRRATLLQADRIGADGLVPPVTPRELLLEERRLFYVACTRARERLVVTAVRRADDDGEQPSRFLDELGRAPSCTSSGGRPRPLSLAGLVAELRRTLADPDDLRAAARRPPPAGWPGWPARPSAAGRWCPRPTRRPGGAPGRPAGRSSRVRDPDQPVPVSASVLDALMVCPTQWFLSREAGGVARAHQSANLGQLVHALAERVAERRARRPAPTTSTVLMAHVDEVWDRLEFRTPWSKAREHERVRGRAGPLPGLAPRQHRARCSAPRRASAPWSSCPTASRCALTGYADRLELDADGRVVVVDLKTGRDQAVQHSRRAAPSSSALYQYAVDHGAVDDLLGDAGRERAGPSWSSWGSPTAATRAVVQPQGAPARRRPRARDALRARLGRTAAAAAGRERSRPSPARTAATAPSCRSARSRAPGR